MATATNTAANTANNAAAPAATAPVNPATPVDVGGSPLLDTPQVGNPAVDAAVNTPPTAEAATKAKEAASSDHWYDFLPNNFTDWVSDHQSLALVLAVVAGLALFVILARIWNGRTVTYTESTQFDTDGLNSENPYVDTAVTEGTDGLSPADPAPYVAQTTLPIDDTTPSA